VTAPVRTLSGGNQQKLVLARELEGAPTLVVAENPTQGLDVRAARAVRARLQEARDAGAGIVVYASDLDELLALADRVVVTFEGSVHEVSRDAEAIGRAMLGAST
jgi:simple sugar transport system ATP-binding protein